MDQRIIQFITALRAVGVRVSLAESSDAFQAIEQMGVKNKDSFRIGLRSTLIKESKDIPQFEKLFPLFFSSNQPPMFDTLSGLTAEEAQKLAQALQQFTHRLRAMMEKLLQGKPLTQQELNQLDQIINMDNVEDLRLQGLMARRMEQALQFKEVRQALESLMQLLQDMGMNRGRLDQLRKMLQANQQAMQGQLYQHAGQKIVENMARNSPGDPLDDLYNQPFQNLSEEEMKQLRREVQRLAAALRTRMALRLKHAKNGQLDVKGTLRANLKYGSVPLELKHRNRMLKPQIVVLCDISTSMRHLSELMLTLLSAIQDQISKTNAFAYIDHLEYISPDFAGQHSQEAVAEVLGRMPSGYYNTDLGRSLVTLLHDYPDKLDYRSTLIVVGDGRNNFNDPHLESFRTIARRSRSTIWLNPEAVPMWGTGDSDMLKYAPMCDKAFQVSNLVQLSAAIDQLFLNV
ncbi:MAG: VWA domain-containing protein [Chloroflexi bacterium]|nr:VWA domain-containing protein [Chloroflexota bacterium]